MVFAKFIRSDRRPPHSRRAAARQLLMEALEARTLLTASLDPISAQTVPGGKSLIVPLTGGTTDGRSLTYAASSNDPSISVSIIQPSTELEIDTTINGVAQSPMKFILFNNIAPDTVSVISSLVNGGKYTNSTFHRVIQGFMAQGGTLANSADTPSQFDDEFSSDAIFSGSHQLAMANAGPDTNTSEFFITDGAQRFLDLKYTIFGQLVRGGDAYNNIITTPVTAQGGGNNEVSKPTVPIVITGMSFVTNKNDAVLVIRSASASATGTVTVSVNDGNGSNAQAPVAVTSATDSTNDVPFLQKIAPQYTTPGTPINITIPGVDLENNPLTYTYAFANPTQIASSQLNGNVLTVTPAAGFTGTIDLIVGVTQAPSELTTIYHDSTSGLYYRRGRNGNTTGGSSTQQAEAQTFAYNLVDPQWVSLDVHGPRGSVDLLSNGGILGWAQDNSSSGTAATAINVRVDIDGATGTPFAANQNRPDLTGPLGSANHGFGFTMPMLAEGNHSVKVYAVDAHGRVTLLANKTVVSYNSLFDENLYLITYPDVAAAVVAGTFTSGWQHYELYGQYEERNPNRYFDSRAYLAANPDVAAAIQAGVFASAFDHFYKYGQYEGRPGMVYFDEAYYRQTYPDVAAAVASHAIKSGFEHFLLYGQYEGRNPIRYFNTATYLAANPDINASLGFHPFRSAYEHFVASGQWENRTFSSNYIEAAYLYRNPDVAAAVAAHTFRNGWQHFINYGQFEGRPAVWSPAVVVDVKAISVNGTGSVGANGKSAYIGQGSSVTVGLYVSNLDKIGGGYGAASLFYSLRTSLERYNTLGTPTSFTNPSPTNTVLNATSGQILLPSQFNTGISNGQVTDISAVANDPDPNDTDLDLRSAGGAQLQPPGGYLVGYGTGSTPVLVGTATFTANTNVALAANWDVHINTFLTTVTGGNGGLVIWPLQSSSTTTNGEAGAPLTINPANIGSDVVITVIP